MSITKGVLLAIAALICMSVLLFTCNVIGIGAKHVTNSMENAVISYDEYQNIKATCDQLNTNLGIVQSTPSDDAQFSQFSKAQRENAIREQLSRWVNEYNAKSQHIDKKWWKSGDLPYRLDVTQFSNYQNK